MKTKVMTTEWTILFHLVAGFGTMDCGIFRSFADSGFAATLLSRNLERLPPLPEGAHAVEELPNDPPDFFFITRGTNPVAKLGISVVADILFHLIPIAFIITDFLTV